MSDFLDQLEISTRLRNILRVRMPNLNLQDLMSLSERTAKSWKGFDRMCWREVCELKGHFTHLQHEQCRKKGLDDLYAYVGQVNDLLMRHPEMRVVVNPDGSLVLARTMEHEAKMLHHMREVLQGTDEPWT